MGRQVGYIFPRVFPGSYSLVVSIVLIVAQREVPVGFLRKGGGGGHFSGGVFMETVCERGVVDLRWPYWKGRVLLYSLEAPEDVDTTAVTNDVFILFIFLTVSGRIQFGFVLASGASVRKTTVYGGETHP